MKAFLGVQLLMGVVKLPNYRAYWSTDEILHQEFISRVMPKNRYEDLCINFHLNDNTNPERGVPGHDKLHKVRPVIEISKATFKKLYNPHREVAVDEAMIKFKGRCGFLQYVPAKPHKWGIKAWALCDSTSYYMNTFDIYTGKDLVQDAGKEPLGTRVVMKLVTDLDILQKYHHVYFDNYFTSVNLVQQLLANSTYSCGTVRSNRKGLPPELKNSKLKTSGEHLKFQKGGMTSIAWCEKKRKVCLLTSANRIDDIQINKPGKRGQPARQYPKPRAIQEYTEHFNAVDKNDQMRSYYGSSTKAFKWWKYIYWFLVDVSMINAYVLYTEAPGGPRTKLLSHLEFHIKVAKALIGNFSSRKRRSVMMKEPPPAKKEHHEATKIGSLRGKRNCYVCSEAGILTPGGKKVQSTFECKICQVAVCKGVCFATFHHYIE